MVFVNFVFEFCERFGTIKFYRFWIFSGMNQYRNQPGRVLKIVRNFPTCFNKGNLVLSGVGGRLSAEFKKQKTWTNKFKIMTSKRANQTGLCRFWLMTICSEIEVFSISEIVVSFLLSFIWGARRGAFHIWKCKFSIMYAWKSLRIAQNMQNNCFRLYRKWAGPIRPPDLLTFCYHSSRIDEGHGARGDS